MSKPRKKQRWHVGSRVRIGVLPAYMSHFPQHADATVLHTYYQKYGHGRVTAYALAVDGRGYTAWYNEEHLSTLQHFEFMSVEEQVRRLKEVISNQLVKGLG